MKKGKHASYNKYKKRNFFLRAKPWLIALLCVVIVLAIGAGIYYFVTEYSGSKEESEAYYEAAGESALPVLTMEYNGLQINELCAYSAEMDLEVAAQALYLLENTYEIPIEADLKSKKVSSVDFYVYDIENSSLIQNGTAQDIKTEDAILTASLILDEVISNDKEYVLDIVLTLNTGKELHYYTRVLRTSGLYVAQQIELALSYMEATLAGDEDILYEYMNVNPWTQKNTNFSGVNLNSSYKQMMWQQMDVSLYGEASVTILDINGYIGCYQIDYIVTRTDDDVTEYYRVSEYYRIRLNSTYTSILTYERTVDQIFIPSEDILSTSSVELGILSSDDIETASSDDGNYSCFIVSGSLWCMDSSQKTLIEIFSFEPEDVSDITNAIYDHDIKILSVDDSGDIVFINYGYMSAGLHEGFCGVGLYRYSAENGQVTELLFVQTDLTWDFLEDSIGQMACLNENNILYILIGQSLYGISLDDYSVQMIAEGLTDDTYKVSLDGSVIAWQEDGCVNDADSIVMFNASSQETLYISAQSGMSIKILGFIGEDLVYGQGEEGSYYTDDSGEELLLMSDIYVKDISGTTQSSNTSDSGYYVSAEYEYNRIIVTKNNAEEFTLYSSELSEVQTPEVSSSYDEIKETIYSVSFISKTTTAGDFTIDTQTAAYLSADCMIEMSGLLDLSDMYIVYGKGSLQLITSLASEAIQTAYESEGCVKTSDGYFYRRGLVPGTVTFTDDKIANSIEAYEAGSVINISGLTVPMIQYFIGDTRAVIWETDEAVYLIYGYDTSTNIRLYDIETGQTSLLSNTDMTEALEEYPALYLVE